MQRFFAVRIGGRFNAMNDENKEAKRRFDDVLGKMLKTPPKPHEAKGDGKRDKGRKRRGPKESG